jgi:flagellar basal body-associated protein FliL
MTEVLAQNQPAIRNLITRILRYQTEAEARADDAIDRLQTTMTEQLAELLNMEEFRALYISDYVVQ